MRDRHIREFDQYHEVNFSLNIPNLARFRISAFTQRGSAGMVMRLISNDIPTIDELSLPPILKDIAMTQRGLVIFLGGTGCGKTSSIVTFDQTLFNLYEAGRITYETAIRHADSANNLRLRIKLESQHPQSKVASEALFEIEEDRRH